MGLPPVPLREGVTFGAGLFTGQTDPESGDDPAAIYRALPDIARMAEDLGFDALWSSEHHTSDDGYLSSPLIALAAAAGATTKIALGTAVCLAPLYHPLRLAEDAHALQQISAGRLVLGLGIGYRDEEFEAFGVTRGRRGRIFDADVRAIRSLLDGETVTGSEPGGFETTNAYLRPVLAEPPAIWLGGIAEAALQRAARLGDGYIVSRGPIGFVLKQLDVLDAALEGRPIDIGVPLTIAPTDLGWDVDRMLSGLLYTEKVYSRWNRRAEPTRASVADLKGDVDQVTGQLAPLLERLGKYRSGHIFFRFILPGLGAAQLGEMMQSMTERLIPRLKELT